MPNPNYSPDWRGWIQLKKTAGSATNPAVATQFSIPAALWQPRNPQNKVRPDQVNAATYETVSTLGMKTPTSRIVAALKASWWGINLVNMLVGNRDANFATDEFAVGGNNVFGTRVYDGCHCAMLQLSQNLMGGPVSMTMDAIGQYGDNEKGTPTSFSAPSVDPGQLLDVTKVGFGGTADLVVSWVLTLMVRCRWRPAVPGTQYSQGIAIGRLTGTFVIEQSPTHNTSPSTSATLAIGSAGAGVSFALSLDPDDDNQPQTTDEGTVIRTYTLADLAAGGNPAIATAM
jgi:hypothetical protein